MKNMEGVTKALDKAMSSMDLEKVSVSSLYGGKIEVITIYFLSFNLL